MPDSIIIVDYGSQTTLLIARRLREMGFLSIIQPPHEKLADNQYVILSGGPASVQSDASPKLPPDFFDQKRQCLGICYGMQLLLKNTGGKVDSAKSREFGAATCEIQNPSPLFDGVEAQSVVWMSHGDHIDSLGPGWNLIAATPKNIAAATHLEKDFYGLQFHPEVAHTTCGRQILQNFAEKICRLRPNWDQHTMLESIQVNLPELEADQKVLMAVSGGVDSTVAAVLLSKHYGKDRVTPVLIDHGLLRHNEVDYVSDLFRSLGLDQFVILDRSQEFFADLKDITDPEQKRKKIGAQFINSFDHWVQQSGQNFTHLGQGTLYPDVVESSSYQGTSQTIKTHHNVGGLPEKLNLKLIEPFRLLFKDEVRILGQELGIPPSFLGRHPFPGPGLAIRCPGSVDPESIALLRQADYLFTEYLRKEELYDQIWQAFAVLLPVKSVGVMGDQRTYEKTVVLRAIVATDGMTAHPYDFSVAKLQSLAQEIVEKITGVNRVLLDITPKPPATIEWE